MSSFTSTKSLKSKAEKKNDGFLDFFVMGFPKCGTTSMMNLFDQVTNETVMIFPSTGWEYSFKGEDQAKTLVDEIKETSKKYNKTKKFGIKWPTALVHPSVIRDLINVDEKHKETKLIIGLRHPVKWFESFYNFRLRKHDMPPANTLIGGSDVKGHNDCYTGLAQYEIYFMQFGKVDLTAHELGMMHNNKPAMTMLSTPNKIFLYMVEQFKDENLTRTDNFFSDLVSFMDLEETITSDIMPKRNINNKKPWNICDDANKKVREVLVQNGIVTANW
eukprot:CAMPEP_0172505028 /NCGR_PEP_ID=MMETSP1066-20121228/183069_1 /TAXON_ID=671091 /ORGANISM="Coscinodiscus wailesii, Strain CCMP2513" /LENGTH=274 /DNA_ID=CAMNT_0013281469 /DNA_START=166 /DNA_END=987 /DNA_ORIENTATION=+